MSLIYHERPGVYSDYDASSVTAAGSSDRVIALVGMSDADEGIYTLRSYAAGKEAFGETSQLGKMVKAAYLNGAGTVLACPVAADTQAAYEAAFALVFEEKKAGFCAVGSAKAEVHEALMEAVEEASGQKGECIGIVGMASPTLAGLLDRAEDLNSERMVLVGPDVYMQTEQNAVGGYLAAAALAGVLADQSDPAMPLNGQVLHGFSGVSKVFNDTEIDSLVRGGVTVLECVGGKVSVMRGITTRTMTGSEPDSTFRELTTMLIVDDVIPAIRSSLRSKFTRAKNNPVTRNAIRNQVVVELEDRKNRQIIEDYDNLTVSAASDDPTVCLVEFEFTVVHGLNRICLTAHISV